MTSFILQVAKAASTSFVTSFLVLVGHQEMLTEKYTLQHMLLRKLMPAVRPSADLTGITSFLTVRHPFDRILSAYRYPVKSYINVIYYIYLKVCCENICSDGIIIFRHLNPNHFFSEINFVENTMMIIMKFSRDFEEHTGCQLSSTTARLYLKIHSSVTFQHFQNSWIISSALLLICTMIIGGLSTLYVRLVNFIMTSLYSLKQWTKIPTF